MTLEKNLPKRQVKNLAKVSSLDETPLPTQQYFVMYDFPHVAYTTIAVSYTVESIPLLPLDHLPDD